MPVGLSFNTYDKLSISMVGTAFTVDDAIVANKPTGYLSGSSKPGIVCAIITTHVKHPIERESEREREIASGGRQQHHYVPCQNI